MDNTTQPKQNTGNGHGLRWKLLVVIVIILIGIGTYGYFWYQETNEIRQKAAETVTEAQQYHTLQSAITDELRRCENFISQQEGDFGNFAYCQQFIDWAEQLSVDLQQ